MNKRMLKLLPVFFLTSVFISTESKADDFEQIKKAAHQRLMDRCLQWKKDKEARKADLAKLYADLYAMAAAHGKEECKSLVYSVVNAKKIGLGGEVDRGYPTYQDINHHKILDPKFMSAYVSVKTLVFWLNTTSEKYLLSAREIPNVEYVVIFGSYKKQGNELNKYFVDTLDSFKNLKYLRFHRDVLHYYAKQAEKGATPLSTGKLLSALRTSKTALRLESLTLYGGSTQQERYSRISVKILNHFKNLKTIHLGGVVIESEEGDHLNLPKLTRIQKLRSIGLDEHTSNNFGRVMLRKLDNLEVLDISVIFMDGDNKRAENERLLDFNGAYHLDKLSYIRVGSFEGYEEKTKHRVYLRDIPRGTKTLILKGERFDNKSLKHFIHDKIESLSLQETKVDKLNFLEHFENLKEFSITGKKLTDISDLNGIKIPKLEKLSLRGNQIKAEGEGDKAVLDLSQLKAPNLTQIDLSNNQIQGQMDFGAIAALKPRLPKLSRLNVDKNQITSLSGLASLEALTTLSAQWNQISTLEGIHAPQNPLKIWIHKQNPLLGDFSCPKNVVCTPVKRKEEE